MTRGSMGTSQRDRYGVRRAARRWLAVWAMLAAVFSLPLPAAGQLPPHDGLSSPNEGFFDSGARAAGPSLSGHGMIGPSGACTAPLLDDPKALLGPSTGSYEPSPTTTSLAPPDGVSDWILPGEMAPGADDGNVLGPGGEPWATRPRYVGPIRRWMHRFFGAGPAMLGGDFGPQALRMRQQWRFRPFSFSAFMGAVSGSPLIDDWVAQGSGYLGGYRLGWDWSVYWGCEMRLGFGWLDLADSQRAIDAQERSNEPYLQHFDESRDSDLVVWDLDLLWYPWGDVRWRPYLMAGIGVAWVDFIDRLAVLRSDSAFELPLGAGVKYRWYDWLFLRFDVTDNIIFGRHFDTVHDLSFTGGLEIRFGGPRTSYWPWNPGRYYW